MIEEDTKANQWITVDYPPLIVNADPWCNSIGAAVEKASRDNASQPVEASRQRLETFWSDIGVITAEDRGAITADQIKADAEPLKGPSEINLHLNDDVVSAGKAVTGRITAVTVGS